MPDQTLPPPSTTTAPILPAQDALHLLRTSSPTLLLVDVRRTDYEGGTIRGSMNLPAQSFWLNRGALYDLCKRAGVSKVAFYCGSCGSRGPRCSGWFAEYIAAKGDADMEALTLQGGIKGWVKAGEEYTEYMDGFEEEYWKQFA